jgi:hypothetical protein
MAVDQSLISWLKTAIGGKPPPTWTCITPRPINIDFFVRTFLNVTERRKCVTLRPNMRQSDTGLHRKAAF